jgi:EAL domain-containing protein (putative c-di-GMP-specific phosphodiesterase class I)
MFAIDVTEAAFIDHPQPATDALTYLRALGIKVALDDFGTGVSSLTTLCRAPLDEVKIDSSVIACLEGSTDDTTLVSAISHAARTAGLKLIAEGVDSTKKLRRLQALGCHYAQGMLFAPPAPISHLIHTFASA